MSIAQALFDIIRDEAERHGLSRIERITVQIGEMAAVVPEALRLCFSVISRGTFAEDAELDIEVVPVVARCRRCGLMFEVENFLFRCPDCGADGADCISGRELLVLGVEGLSGGER